MSQLIDQSIQTVKKLSSELRPEILDILGLAPAIEWYAGDFQKRTGIKCRLTIGEKEIELDEEYRIDCYRILQEALTNISLHSEATRTSIYLKQEDRKLIMKIRDNGRGIPPSELNNSRAFGLIGMMERAKSIGGTLEIKGTPGKGTTIKLSVPTKS
jgi:signal transduction histidine kinase